MATKAQWKQPDGGGGYEVVHHETSAEMVTYGGGNVKDYLDGLSGAGVSLSTFVRGLATAEDASAARAVLQTSKENFFDETGNRWNSSGAMLSTDQSYFGSTSLYLNGSSTYLRRVPSDAWYHVEVTYNNSDGKMRLFVDGALKNTPPTSYTADSKTLTLFDFE